MLHTAIRITAGADPSTRSITDVPVIRRLFTQTSAQSYKKTTEPGKESRKFEILGTADLFRSIESSNYRRVDIK